MMQERQLVERHGVQIRVIGDLSLLPDGVHAAAMRCMAATSHHRGGVLNICFAYTCVRVMDRESRLVCAVLQSGCTRSNCWDALPAGLRRT